MALQLSKSEFPFIGGSYAAQSVTFDSCQTLNMYPELHNYGAGKNGEPAYLLSRPGLRPVQNLGTGPIRATYTTSNTTLTYVVSGNEVYVLSSATGIPILLTGNLTTSTGFVSVCDNGLHVLMVDGANGYFIEIGQTTVTTIVSPNFYNGARTCTYLGGYFICDEGPGSQNFFISLPDSTTWPPNNISSVDSSPDTLVGVIANNQQLYLLGTRTTEVWSLTGATGSAPFDPILGRTANIGATAPATIQRLAGTFLWLGANEQGDGVIYSMENESPTRVSTHAIEQELQVLGDLSTATAFGFQWNGHQFYAIAAPGLQRTLVYDMTTKQWVDFTSMQNGFSDRWWANTHAFLVGQHLVGDYRSGVIYILDREYFQDADQPLRRRRRTPHSSRGVQQVKYGPFVLDIQPGQGTAEINPRYVLRFSIDGGNTWGNPIYGSGGYIGEYLQRVMWRRLPRGRDLVFEVTCDDPCNVVMLSAQMMVTPGTA